MKAIKYLSIAAASLILASCAKEELIPDNDPIPAGFTTVNFVSNCDMKTSIGEDLRTTSWDENENVLLWEGETPLTIDEKSYEGGILTITANVTSKESTFYSVIGPTGEGNATRTSAAVLATQKPKPASFDPNAEVLVAQPTKCGEENTVVLRYNRPVAITVATLKNLEAGEKVQKVTIKADKQLTGNVNFTYVGTNVKAEMEGNGDTITCEYTTGNVVGDNSEFPVYFISLNADVMVFEFEVCTDKHKYYRKITRTAEQGPIVLNNDRAATFGFKLENADKADAEGEKFVKVTSEPTDWSGEYLLVYEPEEGQALCWTGVDAGQCHTDVTIENNEIAAKPANAVTLTIASMSDGSEGYSITVNGGEKNGKFIGQTDYTNGLAFSDTELLNTLELGTDGVVISGTGYSSTDKAYVTLRYNNIDGASNERFRYYRNSQQPVQLYKKTAGGYGKYTLATPKNIKAINDGKSIVWDAVENAGKYSVSYTGTDLTVGESGTVSTVVEECIIKNVSPDYYSVTVQALPKDGDENYQASVTSEPVEITVGTPTLKKPNIDTKYSATTSSITITWTADARATNGFTSWITTVVTGEGGKEETGEQIGDTKQIAPDADKTVTFENLNGNTSYRVFVQANAVVTPKEYAESPSTYKTVKTAEASTIKAILETAITGSGASFAVEDAQIIAFGTNVCWLKDNTGAILAQVGVPTGAKIGDHVSISGTVDSNHRFNNQSIITFKEEGTYTEPAQVAVLDVAGMESRLTNFTAGEYVKYAGKVTSSGDYYRVNVGSNNALGTLFATGLAELSTVEYATITGYLTYLSSNKYLYTIATEVVNNILNLDKTELTWEANEITQKSVSITTDEGADWTFEPTGNTDWNISKDGNTLNVSPASANTSTNKKELTVTLTHATNKQLTKEIKLTQNGKEAVYEKVMGESDLSVGDEIVITSFDGKQVMGEQRENNVGAVGTTPVVSENYSTIKLPSSVLKLTLEAGTKPGEYAFTWKDDETTKYLYAASSNSNHLKSQSANNDNGSWSITIDNGTASIVAKGTNTRNTLQYNSGSTIFACYSSASQSAVAIYKIDNTTPRNLQFPASADTKDIKDGKNINALTLTGNTEGGITYSSTNTAVATIDNSGAITLVSAGTTTIKAKAPKTATLKAEEVSYTLTVIDTRVKEKLTSPSDLSSGTPTSNGTTLSWTSVTNAGSYKVEYKESGESEWASTVVTTAPCELTGLKASTTYSWRVTAIPSNTETHSNSDAATGSDFTTAAGGGTDHTVTWTATNGGLGTGIGSGTIKTGDYSWDYTRTLKSGSSYTGWTSNCIQLGKNGGVENITLSTSNIPGTIKSVSVECSSYNNAHKVNILVGDTTYKSSTATAKWTTVGTVTGTGTSSGKIEINFTDGTRALYIKSISVTYNN